MTTMRTRHKLVRGGGAAALAALMVITGLAPTGADAGDLCETRLEPGLVAGTLIVFRTSICKPDGSVQGLRSDRYSVTTGEIMWDRTSGSVGYEIRRDGVSLGVHDVLSWYMTGLQNDRATSFEIRAVDANGNFMGSSSSVTLSTHS